ncbi:MULTISPECIES: NAD(P)-dependent oxidoreductase [unclassified Methylomonas]|uniref:SDR family oxidoreductase n=1 Tax=unclassified Methylomonas TaxID=2608980 RepID=UPI0008D927ED|nr:MULTISPECIES: NAD(P)-dependent oxidoreductase [unclassified Methylomonas]OHX35245.1 hypothetical protein BJL95_01500 [Methylomonas sp. LWB]WGS87809.1 NAD(P)-dependent oxidoreductase [Methylomonas sp. UP202]
MTILANSVSVGVLGATSHVGKALLYELVELGFPVFAFSRRVSNACDSNVRWENISQLSDARECIIPYWVSLAPIAVLPGYFDALMGCGVRRIVVLSSTSRFSKAESSSLGDRQLAQSFIDSEQKLRFWAEQNNIEWVILRPTLIYGLGRDKNVCEIIRLIRRFRFFPLFGDAQGLRQPIHCRDVAIACCNALASFEATNKDFNLSGGETLSYCQMVERLFRFIDCTPRFIKVPTAVLRGMLRLLRLLPRYRNWTFSMVERMGQDLVFDHSEATRHLNFTPRVFKLDKEDLPR